MGAGNSRIKKMGGENNEDVENAEKNPMRGGYPDEDEFDDEIDVDDPVVDVIKEKGYDALPDVMSPEEFDRYIEAGGVSLARGISANTEEQFQQFKNDFMNGDYYVEGGEAYFGQGVYAFGNEDAYAAASRYANGNGGIMEMSLKKDAKVWEVNGIAGRNTDTITKYFNIITNPYSTGYTKEIKPQYKDMWEDVNSKVRNLNKSLSVDVLRSKGYDIPKKPDMKLMSKDLDRYIVEDYKYKKAVSNAQHKELRSSGILNKEEYKLYLADNKNSGYPSTSYVASQGYDAIKLSKEYVNGNSNNGPQEIWIILNRNKVIVKGDK